MPKHTNVVRFRVKSGKQAEFESLFSKADNGTASYFTFWREPAKRAMLDMASGKTKSK